MGGRRRWGRRQEGGGGRGGEGGGGKLLISFIACLGVIWPLSANIAYVPCHIGARGSAVPWLLRSKRRQRQDTTKTELRRSLCVLVVPSTDSAAAAAAGKDTIRSPLANLRIPGYLTLQQRRYYAPPEPFFETRLLHNEYDFRYQDDTFSDKSRRDLFNCFGAGTRIFLFKTRPLKIGPGGVVYTVFIGCSASAFDSAG